MITKLKPYLYSEDDEEKFQLAEWIWNSHWWVEDPAGYYVCKWCGRHHTSTMPIFSTDTLCLENPAIKKLKDGKEKQGGG